MKKSLITAALTLCFAAVTNAATITSSATTGASGTGVLGFDFNLSNTTWLTSSETLTDTVSLNTTTIGFYNSWYTLAQPSGAMGLAIYEKNSAGVWEFVGKSTWISSIQTVANPLTEVSFSFTDLQLSSSTTYTGIFYGFKDNFDALDESSTLSSLSGVEGKPNSLPNATTPIVVAGVKYDSKTGGNNLYTGTNGTIVANSAPVISFDVTNVPEPATASLSLLGLAALAMRRRRA